MLKIIIIIIIINDYSQHITLLDSSYTFKEQMTFKLNMI